MEKITIILPVYNAENTIQRCLKSIMKQAYKNIEIIVIDDFSTDSSVEKIEGISKEDNRVKLIKNSINKGVSVCRNLGLECATGEFVTFIDADDWLEKDAIKKMHKCILEKNVDAVRTSFYYHSKNKIVQVKYDSKYSEKILMNDEIKNFEIDLLRNKHQAYLWILMLKTQIAKKIKFNTQLGMMEDTVWYLEMLKNITSIYFSNNITYNYIYNENSASNSLKKAKRNIKNVLYIKKLYDDLYNNNLEMTSAYSIGLMGAIIENIHKFCLAKEKHKSKLTFLKELANNKAFINLLNDCDMKQIRIDRRITVLLLKIKMCYMTILYAYIKEKLKR